MPPKPKTSKIERFGPFWQYECTQCREMSDCFDSEKEREDDIKAHKCTTCVLCNQPIESSTSRFKCGKDYENLIVLNETVRKIKQNPEIVL